MNNIIIIGSARGSVWSLPAAVCSSISNVYKYRSYFGKPETVETATILFTKFSGDGPFELCFERNWTDFLYRLRFLAGKTEGQSVLAVGRHSSTHVREWRINRNT